MKAKSMIARAPRDPNQPMIRYVCLICNKEVEAEARTCQGKQDLILLTYCNACRMAVGEIKEPSK